MNTFIAILALCITTSLEAGNFDRWYFEFHTAPVAITGSSYTTSDATTLKFSGKRTGSISADGNSFVEKSTYKYEPANIETPMTIVWKSTDKDGFFTGSSHDPNGIAISFRMTIENQTSLTIESKSRDGRVSIERGKLNSDGNIHFTNTLHSKEGDLIIKGNFVLSRAAKE